MMVQTIPENSQSVLSVVRGQTDRAGVQPGSGKSPVRNLREESQARVAPNGPEQTKEDKSIEEIVAQVQEVLKQSDSRVQVSVEEDLNRAVIQVVDNDSGELIRQFPPEEILNLQRFLKEHSGMLLEEEA